MIAQTYIVAGTLVGAGIIGYGVIRLIEGGIRKLIKKNKENNQIRLNVMEELLVELHDYCWVNNNFQEENFIVYKTAVEGLKKKGYKLNPKHFRFIKEYE